jgi:hypothetical protein
MLWTENILDALTIEDIVTVHTRHSRESGNPLFLKLFSGSPPLRG